MRLKSNALLLVLLFSRGGDGGSDCGASGGAVYIETNVAHVGGKLNDLQISDVF